MSQEACDRRSPAPLSGRRNDDVALMQWPRPPGPRCVIRGCVPKKLFVYGSGFSADIGDSAGFGWKGEDHEFNWAHLMAAKVRQGHSSPFSASAALHCPGGWQAKPSGEPGPALRDAH